MSAPATRDRQRIAARLRWASPDARARQSIRQQGKTAARLATLRSQGRLLPEMTEDERKLYLKARRILGNRQDALLTVELARLRDGLASAFAGASPNL